jgi:hypothetical protein
MDETMIFMGIYPASKGHFYLVNIGEFGDGQGYGPISMR